MATGYAKSKRAIIFWSRSVAALVVLFPLSLSKVDFRSGFSKGLSVSLHKSSPAFAAFEDLHENFENQRIEFPQKMELLAAGQVFERKKIQKLVQQRQLTLAGMVLRAPAMAEPAHPIYVAGQKVKATTMVASDYHDGVPSSILALPKTKAEQIQEIASSEDWSVPNVADLAEQLVHQQIKSAPPVNQKIIKLTSGSKVTIGGNIEAPVTPAEESKKSSDEVSGVPTIASLLPRPDEARPLWLNGNIEMTGGLAYVGPETQMVIKRVQNGEAYERGRIWVTEGKFEIYVKNPTGFLVAELQTRDGRLLGRGEMNLSQLESIPAKDNRIYNIRLALRPMTDGARFPVVSGYSHGQQKMAVREARVEIESFGNTQLVDDEGVATEPNIDPSSTFVVRAQAKKHWSTLVVGQAERSQDIRLFSESLVEALVGISLNKGDQREAFEQSIVWGQVTHAEQPVSGAQVEMAGSYQPIYFNEMYIPDPTLKTTSSNGLFAFLKVRPGVQAIRIKSNGRIFPAQIFPTEAKHVSYVDVEIRNHLVTQFKVTDVMNMQKPVEARIRMVGTDEVLGLSGEGLVEYSVAANPFMVEAEGGPEFEVSRKTLVGQPQMAYVPLVKRDWLYELQQKKGIASFPGRGVVVGFVDDSNFEVEMTGYAKREAPQVVYFDANGQILSSRHGVAGGGFAIFNAPSGLQTVFIHPANSRETHSEVVVAEPQYIHVITWSAADKRK